MDRAHTPRPDERSRSRLASRSSIFGGSLSTRDEARMFGGMAQGWRSLFGGSFGRSSEPQPARTKRRSLNEIAVEAMAKNDREGSKATENRPSNTERRKTAGETQRTRATTRPLPARKPTLHRQMPSPPSPPKRRPQFKGTFYGEDHQPECALRPIPVEPTYSEQSDLEDLIDDEDVGTDDGEWTDELMKLLGSYAGRDFTRVDAQRNFKMQATTAEIFEAERKTAKIGKEVDKRERKLMRSEKRKEKDQIVKQRKVRLKV